MEIVDVAPGVFRVEGGALKLPLGLRLPIAATVATLEDGSLAIYSPVDFDDATAAAIDARGKVSHLIAPNTGHHLFLGKASKRWPHALVHVPQGVAAKQPTVRVDRTFGVDATPELASSFEVETIAGAPKLAETVLLHRASGTLLCGDLLFHVTKPANTMTKIVFSAMGTGGGKLAQSRMVGFFVKDKVAARVSAQRLLSWPIRGVAPCHGEHAAIDAATLGTKLSRMGYTP